MAKRKVPPLDLNAAANAKKNFFVATAFKEKEKEKEEMPTLNESKLIQIEKNYTANPHPHFDTLLPGALTAAVNKLAGRIGDFDDSNLTAEQLAVRDAVLTSAADIICVTGEAGTGKTHTQLALLKRLKTDLRENVFRIGPTHGSIANLPQDSNTYQTFFAMPPTIDYLDPLQRTKHVKDMASAALRQPFVQRAKHGQRSTLVIEEAAMISAEVFDLIVDALQLALGQSKSIRLVLFFDLLQLAPVQGKLLVESSHFSNSNPNLQTLILRTNMRQTGAEDDFLYLLRAVAKGATHEIHHLMLKSRVFDLDSAHPHKRICARNANVDLHNLDHLNRLPAQIHTFRALDVSLFEKKKKIPDYALAKAPCRLSWAVGAKIVFESTPLHECGLFNGITGKIVGTVGTDTDMILPIVHIDRYKLNVVVHPYKEDILTEVSGATAPTVQAERTQFPFSIAEATTVHKIQGQTVTVPTEIDLAHMHNPGQVYTALSRLTSLNHLSIKNLPPLQFDGSISSIRASPIALAWCKKIGL